MKITVGKSKRIMASESDGNYDKSFKAKGTTYYIELLSDGGNYVAKWWDSSDNGLGYNNKGWVAIEGKNYRALNNIEDVNSDNVVDLLSVISDYDRKPGKPIQDRIKREVANLIDFDSINSSCGKKSVKASAVMGAMDTENLTIYVPSYCYVDVMVDSYEQGEGEQVNSWTFQVADGFRTAQELIDDIAESSGIFSNDINDYVVLDSSLQTDATVNAENDIPTEEELEAWKRGELELYVAHLWVGLQVGSKTHDMTEDEAEAFGLSVY